ncbi:hypothetical protein [Stieleria maiorica]|uniref:hypothetical protein n=1 Tax=Stieleria maiorica TaxID=2795974 RepID=UPI0036F3AAFE
MIEFLVDQKKKGAPAWKRLKIAEALSDYQKRFHRDSGERLERSGRARRDTETHHIARVSSQLRDSSVERQYGHSRRARAAGADGRRR